MDNGSATNVHISIEDTGEGIPVDSRERVFDPFLLPNLTEPALACPWRENLSNGMGERSLSPTELPAAQSSMWCFPWADQTEYQGIPAPGIFRATMAVVTSAVS